MRAADHLQVIFQHLASSAQRSRTLYAFDAFVILVYSQPQSAVSLNEDIDTNKELVAHGYSNLLAGLVGAPYVLIYLDRGKQQH